jgi:hypothetical protein
MWVDKMVWGLGLLWAGDIVCIDSGPWKLLGRVQEREGGRCIHEPVPRSKRAECGLPGHKRVAVALEL